MAGTGPAPNPNSRRQSGSQSSPWTDLPANGYRGEIPTWPLAIFSEREQVVWASIWRTPQAEAWASGWLHDVAMYVRYVVEGESDLKAAAEARMWSDRLGLNPVGAAQEPVEGQRRRGGGEAHRADGPEDEGASSAEGG